MSDLSPTRSSPEPETTVRRDYLDGVPDHEPMHLWFNLTYSSYLVMQRTLIQSMPDDWQRRLYALLNEMEHAVGHHRVGADEFTVNAREGRRFVRDPLCNYERGRRRVTWAADYVPAALAAFDSSGGTKDG